MEIPRQQIRFCTAPDGIRLAYAVSGSKLAELRGIERPESKPVDRPWNPRRDEDPAVLSRLVPPLSLDAPPGDL